MHDIMDYIFIYHFPIQDGFHLHAHDFSLSICFITLHSGSMAKARENETFKLKLSSHDFKCTNIQKKKQKCLLLLFCSLITLLFNVVPITLKTYQHNQKQRNSSV